MRPETIEAVESLYTRIEKWLGTCKDARRKATPKSLPEVMLAGKCKAYIDVLTLIEGRYKKKILFIRDKKIWTK